MSTTLYNELLMDGVHGFLPDPIPPCQGSVTDLVTMRMSLRQAVK